MQLQKLVQIGIEFRIQHLWTIIKKIVRHLYLRTGPTAGLMAAATVTGVAAAAVFGAVAAIA